MARLPCCQREVAGTAEEDEERKKLAAFAMAAAIG